MAAGEVIGSARLAYDIDLDALVRAARALPRQTLDDFISAVVARGPAVPVQNPDPN
jgi:hypothetical protein